MYIQAKVVKTYLENREYKRLNKCSTRNIHQEAGIDIFAKDRLKSFPLNFPGTNILCNLCCKMDDDLDQYKKRRQ